MNMNLFHFNKSEVRSTVLKTKKIACTVVYCIGVRLSLGLLQNSNFVECIYQLILNISEYSLPIKSTTEMPKEISKFFKKKFPEK